MTWFARLRERVFAPYSARFSGTIGWRIEDVPDPYARFRGKVMACKVPPELLGDQVPDGYFAAPVTEIVPSTFTVVPDDIVGRPVVGNWPAISRELSPRPDPSKRWRLFIQEDTRP